MKVLDEVVLGARGTDRGSNDLAGHHIPIADQTERPMTPIFIFDSLRFSGLMMVAVIVLLLLILCFGFFRKR